MSRKQLLRWSIALALMPLPLFAQQDGAMSLSGSENNLNLDYTGDRTRIGVSVDDEGEFSGEVLQVFGEDDDSALIAEGWFGSGAGGLKLNYHWLSEDQDKVYKLFGAVDQNDEEDRKATLGAGLERESYFAGAYYAHALSDEREVGVRSDSTQEMLTGTDATGYWRQNRITTVTTRRFAQAYDHGVGLRIGRFWDQTLVRARLGADYEWGDYDSDQWTYSLGIEKFIEGTGHSLALNVEHSEKSGEFEDDGSDTRGMLTWRYAFGDTYRSRTRTNRLPAASVAADVPETPYKLVKHEVEMRSDAYFDLDSARIRPEHREDLRQIAEMIQKTEVVGKISLVGHTCDLGTEIYNQGLSERRADAVREQLIAFGVPAEHLLTEGRGESQPMAANTSEANRGKNRRVDIHFLKVDEERQALPAVPRERAEWRTETVELPSAWAKRALVNPIAHKRRVDVYHFEKEETRVELGEVEYVNRLPVARDDAASLSRNSGTVLLDVLANDSDEDGDALTITGVTQPSSGGTVENFGDLISFTPHTGFSGETEFTYTVSDGQGGEAEATVRVTVSNDGPTAAADSATTSMDVPVTIDVLANDSDPNGDAIELIGVGTPSNGSAVIESGRVVYQPASGFFGSDSFSYTIQDEAGAAATGTVTVTVEEFVNTPPVAVNDRVITPYLPAITANVLANDRDEDGDSLTVTALEGLPEAAVGRYEINDNNTITFYPGPEWDRLAITVTYFIDDGRGGTDSAILTIIDP